MIHTFSETIRFPEKSKNIGYVLVNRADGHDSEFLNEAIHLFFGAFGTHAVFCHNDRYAFCLLLPDKMQKLDLTSIYCENGDFAFIEGTFYDRDILTRFKASDPNRTNSAFARWIFNFAMKEGAAPLKKINGQYSGVVYIAAADRLYCFNDRFGLRKQFIYNHGDKFVLTNNIFALTANRYLGVSVNEAAVCQILQLDYPVGRNTEFNNISHILPPDVLVREKEAITHIEINTFEFDRNELPTKKSIRDLYEKFDAFTEFLHTYLDERLGLFISRGKDSRMFLHFLEKQADYQLFSFMTEESEWSFAEGKHIEEIAEKLSRDLYRLEDFTIDRNIAIMAGLNTTATSSWMALAQLASKYIDYAIIGHGGDVLSGKLETFRHSEIKTARDYMRMEFDIDCKGVLPEEIFNAFPYLRKHQCNMNQYFAAMDKFIDLPIHDFEISHMIKRRWFRHSIPIQHKTHHYLTPIYPYLEKEIFESYCKLPVRLIRSQRAHAMLAAMERKSSGVPSTEFPIPLKTEQYSRPVMMHVIRMNNRLNDKLFDYAHGKQAKKKIDRPANTYENQSTYFKQTVGNRIELKNRQLLHRLKVLDTFLALSLDIDFTPYCNPIDSIEYLGNGSQPAGAPVISPTVQSVADSNQ